jgi:hypothetical protein
VATPARSHPKLHAPASRGRSLGVRARELPNDAGEARTPMRFTRQMLSAFPPTADDPAWGRYPYSEVPNAR